MDYEGIVGPRNEGGLPVEPTARPTLIPSPAQIDPKALNDAWRKNWKAKTERKNIAVLIDLPSGSTIAAVRMPLSYLLKAGHVPDRMTHIVQKQINLLTSGKPEDAMQSVVDDYQQDEATADKEWQDVLDFITIHCSVLPKFAADEDADPEHETDPTFPVSSMDMLDKIYLYEWCQGVSETVETFLHAAATALGIVADGSVVSLSPEQLLRPDQPGGYLAGISN